MFSVHRLEVLRAVMVVVDSRSHLFFFRNRYRSRYRYRLSAPFLSAFCSVLLWMCCSPSTVQVLMVSGGRRFARTSLSVSVSASVTFSQPLSLSESLKTYPLLIFLRCSDVLFNVHSSDVLVVVVVR